MPLVLCMTLAPFGNIETSSPLAGKPIQHSALVSNLLQAILLPASIAVCKCAAHTPKSDPISTCNARADAAAKAASYLPLPTPTCAAHSLTSLTSSLTELQSLSDTSERTLWRKCGCTFSNGVWWGPDGKPCLPKALFPHYAMLSHGLDHVSKGGMLSMITNHWYTKEFSAYAQKHCQHCMIYATHNTGRPVVVTQQAAHQPPTRPFEHLMMDFIELSLAEGKKYCLVMVYMWSKWVEVFPAKHPTAAVVAKALVTEIIPRWGLPAKNSSDNGSHFVNTAIQQVGVFLGIDMRNHCAYHPASGGAIERENRIFEAKTG